jgi:ribosome biogenesis protein Tsr3
MHAHQSPNFTSWSTPTRASFYQRIIEKKIWLIIYPPIINGNDLSKLMSCEWSLGFHHKFNSCDLVDKINSNYKETQQLWVEMTLQPELETSTLPTTSGRRNIQKLKATFRSEEKWEFLHEFRCALLILLQGMAANKVNWAVVAMLLTCYVIAFALAIAAEEHRAQVIITPEFSFSTNFLTNVKHLRISAAQLEHPDNTAGSCILYPKIDLIKFHWASTEIAL